MILFNFSLFTFTINGINIIGITEQINSFLESVTLYIIILDINKIIISYSFIFSFFKYKYNIEILHRIIAGYLQSLNPKLYLITVSPVLVIILFSIIPVTLANTVKLKSISSNQKIALAIFLKLISFIPKINRNICNIVLFLDTIDIINTNVVNNITFFLCFIEYVFISIKAIFNIEIATDKYFIHENKNSGM